MVKVYRIKLALLILLLDTFILLLLCNNFNCVCTINGDLLSLDLFQLQPLTYNTLNAFNVLHYAMGTFELTV